MLQRKRRPRLEVADILRKHGDEYERDFAPSPAHRRVLEHLKSCRTATLGGHKDTCGSCGHVRISYNSCRNRHCPKCQSLKKEEWLEARRARILPTPYFHVVFTIPKELRSLTLGNKRVVFKLLFQAASDTLKTIAEDSKHLGARIGFTAILHTWGQNLQFHPHLHCVVTAGGLTPDGKSWKHARERFFLPVRVISKLFRGKFLAAFKVAREKGDLQYSGGTDALRDVSAWKSFLSRLYRLDWVVYSKPPFGGAEHLFQYLGRYTHRVAISNDRLLRADDGKVTFTIKDYRDSQRRKNLTLDAKEFIRRFLLHVLPKNFVRIRHYGLLAARNVERLLPLSRCLLGGQQPEQNQKSLLGEWWERFLALTGIDLMRCPSCRNGRLVRTSLGMTDLVAVGEVAFSDTS